MLSLVHWAKALRFEAPEIIFYLIGVMPNVAAAGAISFVLLSIWADQKPAASDQQLHRRFFTCALIAGGGLIAWELVQLSSRTLVFDPHDIAATFFGLVIAWLVFVLITPRAN